MNMESMVDPYKASKLRDAFYWQTRAESAEEELARLRAENEKYRACIDAVLMLRHAIAQFDGPEDGEGRRGMG